MVAEMKTRTGVMIIMRNERRISLGRTMSTKKISNDRRCEVKAIDLKARVYVLSMCIARQAVMFLMQPFSDLEPLLE